MWGLALSCSNMPFVMKDMTKGFRILTTYWRAFSHSSESINSVVLSYPIAPQTMIPGVGKVCASIIAASCDLSTGRLRTRWCQFELHKQNRDSSLIATECHSISSCLWLYAMQVSIVCGMVSAVNNTWQVDISTQLPVIYSRPLVVTLCL